MRRFYSPPEQFDGTSVKLSTEETRHLRDVLRLGTGDQVQIFNGDGREFVAEIATVGKRETLLNIVDEISAPAPESNLDLTIAASVYKNDKFDLVIQKAVELGVACISPIITFRSESKIDAALNRIDRWRKIALEATKQCERARIMTIEQVATFWPRMEPWIYGIRKYFHPDGVDPDPFEQAPSRIAAHRGNQIRRFHRLPI